MRPRYNVIALLALFTSFAAITAPASAAPRVPQIAFDSAALQARLNSLGESINVLTDQQDGLVWGSTVSSNATMTILFSQNGNPNGDQVGIARLNALGNVVLGLVTVFPASADSGWFATASFRPGDNLIVTLFDQHATIISQNAFTGVNRSLFAYYIKNANGTFYSHDGFNPDHNAHALAYAGTGQNAGSWWLAWEDATIANYANANFSDAILFMESLNPTEVTKATWSSVKARFR